MGAGAAASSREETSWARGRPVRSICAHAAHSPHRPESHPESSNPPGRGGVGCGAGPGTGVGAWVAGAGTGAGRRRRRRRWRWRDRRRGRRRRRRRGDRPRCLPPRGRSPGARPLSGHVRSRRPRLARERRDRFTRERRRVGERARIVRDDAYRLDLRLISARCDQSRGGEGAPDGEEGGGRSGLSRVREAEPTGDPQALSRTGLRSPDPGEQAAVDALRRLPGAHQEARVLADPPRLANKDLETDPRPQSPLELRKAHTPVRALAARGLDGTAGPLAPHPDERAAWGAHDEQPHERTARQEVPSQPDDRERSDETPLVPPVRRWENRGRRDRELSDRPLPSESVTRSPMS